MDILFQYEKTDRYCDERVVVYANKANIGTLVEETNTRLCWSPDVETPNVKFQFRNNSTFLEVVNELRRYKNENGYKYLTIWTYDKGYASEIDKNLLRDAGFSTLLNENPHCLFLE